MKTFKAFGHYFSSQVLAVQAFMVGGIAYLSANPAALEPLGLPEKVRPFLALFLAVYASMLNSRHSERRVGRPEMGRRETDSDLMPVIEKEGD